MALAKLVMGVVILALLVAVMAKLVLGAFASKRRDDDDGTGGATGP